jgi:sugar-specific transcriptional regulator TrmB
MAKLFATGQFTTENLTAMEEKALSALIEGLYAEPGFSDVDANDLSQWTGIPTRNIRGVISSLIKKGYITIDDSCGNGIYQLIYLNENKWYLHPEWIEEYDAEQYGPIPTAINA